MKRMISAGLVAASTLLAAKAVAVQIGDRAPDFTVPSTMGEIALSRVVEEKPVVLALYFADFTSG